MRKGFTLMELMVVVILVGVLATLALTSYKKISEEGYARNVLLNLVTIRGAQTVYKIKNGKYWPSGPAAQIIKNLSEINAQFNLNITATGIDTYFCQSTGDDNVFSCGGTHFYDEGFAYWGYAIYPNESSHNPKIQCYFGPCPIADISSFL